MKLDFFVFYPGGNPTALVIEPYSDKDRAKIGRAVMKNYPVIEQVGFIKIFGGHKGPILFALKMMGDELCINAAVCAALWWKDKTGQRQFQFLISGLGTAIKAEVAGKNVKLSLPRGLITAVKTLPAGRLIKLKGISYLIAEKISNPKKLIFEYAKRGAAFGVVESSLTAQGLAIKPWVWVKKTKSIIQETACGSGSIAAAVASLGMSKSFSCLIRQPSKAIYTVGFDKTRGLVYFQAKVSMRGRGHIANI